MFVQNTMMIENFGNMISQLSEGYGAALKIFALTLLFSLPLGFIVAFARMSKCKPLQFITKIYISIMRGTPLMLQLIAFYFALIPGIEKLFDFKVPFDKQFFAVILGFVINYAAYFAEIFRGGIESIPTGQFEAGEVLGLTKIQTFMRIILPQVIKNVLPSVTNEIITLVKDTSIAFAIGYVELITIAKQLVAAQSAFTALIVAGGFYYITNLVIEFIMSRIEKRMSRYEQ